MLEVIDRNGKALGDGRDIAADQTFDVSQARGHTTQRRDRRIVLIAGDRNDVRVETAHVRTVLKLGEYDVYQSCSLRPIFRRDIDAHPVSLCEIPDLAHALFVVARQARKVVGQGFQIGDALRRRKGVYSLEPSDEPAGSASAERYAWALAARTMSSAARARTGSTSGAD